jgi:hypothetical protein
MFIWKHQFTDIEADIKDLRLKIYELQIQLWEYSNVLKDLGYVKIPKSDAKWVKKP